jgi:hypothetical protein
MPFVGGRFYANPSFGKGVESAREAEGAGDGDSGDEELLNGSGEAAHGGAGAVHRIVIEATEVVPSHSGRAQSGFVAHVHRATGVSRASGLPSKSEARPETHVFTDHRDVADFVSGALGADVGK